MTTLAEAVRTLDAARRAMYEAQKTYCDARALVVEAARAAGVKSRRVLVLGDAAWYVSPPGGHGNDTWPDGWDVTWGSVPEDVPAEVVTP